MRSILGRLASRHTTAAAYLALFTALGGVSWAAATLPRNSVGSKQLKNNAVTAPKIKANAVTSAKVRNRSLLAEDFMAGQLPAGSQGPMGPQGPTGEPGQQGETGPPGPFPDGPLASGKTIRGTYLSRYSAAGAGSLGGANISFGFMLASAPTPHFVPENTTTPECQGTHYSPTAAPGHLCVYEGANVNRQTPTIRDTDGNVGASVTGAIVIVNSVAAGNCASFGAWAVTAP